MKKTKSGHSGDSSMKNTERCRLILLNDDINGFSYVTKTLEEILYFDEIQSSQVALLAHYKGKIAIKEGTLNEMYEFQEEFEKAGLTVEIQNIS